LARDRDVSRNTGFDQSGPITVVTHFEIVGAPAIEKATLQTQPLSGRRWRAVRQPIVPPESHAADHLGGCSNYRISVRGIKNTSDGRPFEPTHDREEKEQETEWIGKIAGIKCVAPKRIDPE
jgi:hypothetical protein